MAPKQRKGGGVLVVLTPVAMGFFSAMEESHFDLNFLEQVLNLVIVSAILILVNSFCF
jgi:hypothetical protein